MKGWTPQAADRANSLQKGTATSPATPAKGKTPQAEREPAEKHVALPPAPPEVGLVMLHEATRLHAEQINGRYRFVITGPESQKATARAALQKTVSGLNHLAANTNTSSIEA